MSAGNHPNLEFERPSTVQIATTLHRARHSECPLPAEHVDYELADAIIADREASGSRSES